MPERGFTLGEINHVHAMFGAVRTKGISDVAGPETFRILQVNCEENVIAAIRAEMGRPHTKFLYVDCKRAVLSLRALFWI